jgi:hypothetical protein
MYLVTDVLSDGIDIFFPKQIALLELDLPVDTSHLFPLAWALWMTSESSKRTRGWRQVIEGQL